MSSLVSLTCCPSYVRTMSSSSSLVVFPLNLKYALAEYAGCATCFEGALEVARQFTRIANSEEGEVTASVHFTGSLRVLNRPIKPVVSTFSTFTKPQDLLSLWWSHCVVRWRTASIRNCSFSRTSLIILGDECQQMQHRSSVIYCENKSVQ